MCVQWCPGMTKFQSVCARLSWIWPVCEWEGAEKKQGERGRKNEVSRLVGGRDEGGDTWGWGGGPGRDGPRITRLWPSTGNLHTITRTPTYMWAHTCASNVDVSQGKDGKSSVCVCVCVCLSARAVSQGTQMYMHVLCAALCVRLHIACSLPAETERSVPKWARLLHDSRDDLCTKGKWIDLEGDAISI